MGCFIFSAYAARLFLRHKSREIGIFIALGARRKVLAEALSLELGKLIGMCAAAGIALGAVIAFIVGKGMELLTAQVRNAEFGFTLSGLALSALYTVLLFLLIQFLARRAMRRTNVIEVINEQRKQEPMKSLCPKILYERSHPDCSRTLWGGVFGTDCSICFRNMAGGWTNAFYLLIVFGIYRMLVYAVSSHQKGKTHRSIMII